ncbi:MAG: hypothetical protein QOF79_385 [Actinomycetota bacterium]|nr:hypothetical protein [Actinomycetota bacterium]
MDTQSLTFRDVPATVPGSWRRKSRTNVVRELFIDDIPMRVLLAGAGRVYFDGVVAPPVLPSEVSTHEGHPGVPLNPGLPLEYRLAFLNSLIGVPWSEFDKLATGRVPLALCPYDFDPDCGFSSAQLKVEDDIVRWEDVGEELDDWSEYGKSEGHEKPVRVRQGWIPWLYSPPVVFAFNRMQYEQAIRDEILFQSSIG